METAFRITDGKGFGMTFPNGYTVSVQWGPGNYCDNYRRDFTDRVTAGSQGSMTAECAVFDRKSELITLPDEFGGYNVTNRSTATEVLALMNWAASQPKGE